MPVQLELRLPGLAAVALTWLVWYFTSASCPAELAETTGCNPSPIAGYVNLEVLNKTVTQAAEEQAQAAEERRQLLALVERLTERLNGGDRQDSQ